MIVASFMNSALADKSGRIDNEINNEIDKGLNKGIDTVAHDNSYYVDVLERSCKWYDAYDSYYDEETDCYFAYSDEFGVWQYWYEGISSDFGDFGWMEYDEKEARWYIEVAEGNWIVLPKGYNTDKLWHIK